MLRKMIMIVALIATNVYAEPNKVTEGIVKIIGNEPKTTVILDTGKEQLEFSSMYQESMRIYQNKKIAVEYFYVKKLEKSNSIERSKIGVTKVIRK